MSSSARPPVDWSGAVTLGASVLVVGLYILRCWLLKWLHSRNKMDTVAAGMFRLAAARNDIAKLELISRVKHFDVNASLMGFTAVSAAATQGHAGADINIQKDDGWQDTALHYAAARGRLQAVKILLAAGMDADARNSTGAAAADVAAKKGNHKVANFLTAVAKGHEPRPDRIHLIDAVSLPWTYEHEEDDAATALGYSGPQQGPKSGTCGFESPTPVSGGGPEWSPTSGSESGSSASPVPQQSSPASTSTAKSSPTKDGRQGTDFERHSREAPSTKPFGPAMEAALRSAAARGFYGWGCQGTRPKFTAKVFRWLAVATTVATAGYLVWRALRSLTQDFGLFFSIPVWLVEFAGFCMGVIFITSLWSQIDRPVRYLDDMLAAADFPHLDVFICCYSEPVDVMEPTVIAALNMNYPGSRLHVHVLDDGKRVDVQAMVRRIRSQMRYMGREAELIYVARDKAKGVPHHAKAGNINSALLKEAPGQGEFILVLDCDMLVHPDFLLRTLGHFYEHCKGSWVKKEKAGFLQTPQDFWNVDANDPMVHCARFFYGPMLQGRDGIGACPCCGTGVIFQRDVLVSIGGQAYGSITEDYNTAMTLMSAGFGTLFLNERLVFGMAPDDVLGVFTQRLRWSMGALQILVKDNPLYHVGLTAPQAFLFYESAACYLLAIGTVTLAIIPIVYAFVEYSPLVAPRMFEFTAAFGTCYLLNRIMMWWAHRGCEGADQELWRGSQMWVWMATNSLLAVFNVMKTELWIFKWLRIGELGFVVTSKERQEAGAWADFRKGLRVTWPYLLYYTAFAAASINFVVRAALGQYSLWRGALIVAALGWAMLINLCIWPPVAALLPKVETEEGWKVVWDSFLRIPEAPAEPAGEEIVSSGEARQASAEFAGSRMFSLSHKSSLRLLRQLDQRMSSGVRPAANGLRPKSAELAPPDAAAARASAIRSHSLCTGLQYVDEALRPGFEKLISVGELLDTQAAPGQPGQAGSGEAPPAAAVKPEPAASQLRFSQWAQDLLQQRTQPDLHLNVQDEGGQNSKALRELLRSGNYTEEVNSTATGNPMPTLQALSEQYRLPSLHERRQTMEAGDISREAQSNAGAVGLPVYRELALRRTSLLTGMVLPERPSCKQPPELLLNQDGTISRPPPSLQQQRSLDRIAPLPRLPSGLPAATSMPVLSGISIVARTASLPDQQTGRGSIAQPADGEAAPASQALTRWGGSILIPTEPASIYESTIVARPNFRNRQLPTSNYWFITVNGALIVAAIVGSLFDYYLNPNLPVTSG